jgi:hypothetical protein
MAAQLGGSKDAINSISKGTVIDECLASSIKDADFQLRAALPRLPAILLDSALVGFEQSCIWSAPSNKMSIPFIESRKVSIECAKLTVVNF